MISQEILTKYNMVSLEEYKKMFSDATEKDVELLFYDTFLKQTDHIPLKIFERFIEDMATASIVETMAIIVNFFKDVKVTYAAVLAARKTAREKINEIGAASE